MSSHIQVPTEEEVGWRAASDLVEKGEKLVKEGKVKDALAAYQEAQRLKPTWKIPAYSWNTLCWYGSLHGHAAEVMPACEKAVALVKTGNYWGSRGLAKALTGDKQGAIEDFQASIKSNYWDEVWEKQAQGWIVALKAGKNPFTPKEIERLLK